MLISISWLMSFMVINKHNCFNRIGVVFCWLKNYMFRPAMAIIRFFRKRFRRCYTVSVTAYWWGDLVVSVPLFTGSVMILGGSMWKRAGGVWGVSSIKPRNYTTFLLGRSGVSVRVLRVFCFLSLCHLGGSCWGGRALWSSPVGDGEKMTGAWKS